MFNRMYKTKLTKKFPALVALIVIVLFIAQYFLYIDIKKRNQNASSLSNELSLQINKEDYMISTGKIIQNISGDLNKVHRSIVSSTGDVEFIESLERMAERNNLSVSIDSLYLDVNPKATSSPITPLKMKLKTAGRWSGIYKFLKELESMPVKVKINSYSFMSENSNVSSQDSIVPPSGKWESNVDITVLKYK